MINGPAMPTIPAISFLETSGDAARISRILRVVGFSLAGHAPENLYDFTIVSAIPLAFVRVFYCARIHAPVAEFVNEFRTS